MSAVAGQPSESPLARMAGPVSMTAAALMIVEQLIGLAMGRPSRSQVFGIATLRARVFARPAALAVIHRRRGRCGGGPSSVPAPARGGLARLGGVQRQVGNRSPPRGSTGELSPAGQPREEEMRGWRCRHGRSRSSRTWASPRRPSMPTRGWGPSTSTPTVAASPVFPLTDSTSALRGEEACYLVRPGRVRGLAQQPGRSWSGRGPSCLDTAAGREASRGGWLARHGELVSPGPGTPRTLVVGAGIGGLCAAIALRRRGVEVRVSTRPPTSRPSGPA